MQMALDPNGLTELCDRCESLIDNRRWMGMSFLTFDGKVICNNCRTELLKLTISENNCTLSSQ